MLPADRRPAGGKEVVPTVRARSVPPSGDGLVELIAAEHRLAAAVAAATAAAQAGLEAARVEAARAMADASRSLGEEAARLRAVSAAGVAAALAAERARDEQQLGAWAAASDELLATLAASAVAAWVVELTTRGARTGEETTG
jgi:hypothetical protein